MTRPAAAWGVTRPADRVQRVHRSGRRFITPGRVDMPFFDGSGRPPGPALTAERIADTIGWVLAPPDGTDVNQVVLRPLDQPV